jgi:hypothetical protein
MHWRPEHINPMLALRLALLNERWSESWQEQHRLRQHQRQLKRQARQQQRVREQQAKRQEAQPPPIPVPSTPKPTRQKTGRTEAQYRWGRHTFSARMLKQADGAKKCNAPLDCSPVALVLFCGYISGWHHLFSSIVLIFCHFTFSLSVFCTHPSEQGTNPERSFYYVNRRQQGNRTSLD